MKKEEKELLWRDLCARLPYGVICSCIDNNFTPQSIDYKLVSVNLQDETIISGNDVWNHEFHIEDVKPYLRPISSMTEEEVKELVKVYLSRYNSSCEYHNIISIDRIYTHDRYSWSAWIHFKTEDGGISQTCVIVGRVNWETTLSEIDWLNERHFDYRGLISIGLAIEAPEGMYR